MKPDPPRSRSRRNRRETGATTAEYVGIVAFVAIIVSALFVVDMPVRDHAHAVIDKAFCKIGSAFGWAGCSNADLPHYVATKCQLSSGAKQYGGSLSIIATVGGDTGYTLFKMRTRQDDGSYKDSYIVKTAGELKASYEFGPKVGAELSTGKGSTNAKGGASVTVEGSFATGSNYTFPDEQSARDFIDKFKDQWGALGGDVDGAPVADSTYYELGGKGEVSGDLGPLADAKASQKAVLGLETFKNGDKKFKLALTTAGALDLGIPIPASILEASAKGDLSVVVQADVTFDKDGNLTTIGGNIAFTAEVEGGVDFQTRNLDKGYQPRHRKAPPIDLRKLELPQIPHLDKGMSGKLAFDTQFKRPDGSYDSAQVAQLSGALGRFVTGGDLTAAEKAAISKQINQNSQLTFNLNNYDKDTERFGGKVKILIVTVGAEGHVITTEEDVVNGWYYDPTQGTWQQNIACGKGS
jgi:Flp pilus assembly pilin Flp